MTSVKHINHITYHKTKTKYCTPLLPWYLWFAEVTGGTDNHLLLWDLKSEGLSGAKMEKVCEEASIIVYLGQELKVISSPVCLWAVLETLFEWCLGMCPRSDIQSDDSSVALVLDFQNSSLWSEVLRGEKLSWWFLDVACHLRNRNTIASDASPISPGGVRLGSCAMTTRMVDEDGFKKIGGFLIRARDIAINIQKRRGHFLEGNL